MRLPDFLFIGPDKTGSTWLYELLRSHPGCFVPEIKDLYFFDRHFERGLGWYAGYFEGASPDHVAVGEISHDYLFSDRAAHRIRETLPDVRLLSFLRDPLERAFSQYLYLVRAGEARGTFEEALHRFPRITDNSRYHEHLTRYHRRFPADRLGVFVFEELRADEAGFADRVLGFLHPSLPAVAYALPGPTLAAGAPRVAALARLAKAGATAARRLGLPGLVGRIKRSSIVQGALYRPFGDDRPVLSPADARLLAERLADDVRALPDLLGWDALPAAWTTTRDALP